MKTTMKRKIALLLLTVMTVSGQTFTLKGLVTDDEGNAAWGLCLWFDNMRRMYEGYRDVTPTKKKRKRKSKKQVA